MEKDQSYMIQINSILFYSKGTGKAKECGKWKRVSHTIQVDCQRPYVNYKYAVTLQHISTLNNQKTTLLVHTLPFESVVVCLRNSAYLSANSLKSGRESRQRFRGCINWLSAILFTSSKVVTQYICNAKINQKSSIIYNSFHRAWMEKVTM